MSSDNLRRVELFDKLIDSCYKLLFFPHNSLSGLEIENYSSVTNAYFPDLRYHYDIVKDCLKELPLVVNRESPELTSSCINAVAAINDLVINKNSDRDFVPIFIFYRALVDHLDSDRAIERSKLLQVLAGYSSSFEGPLEVYIPSGARWVNFGTAETKASLLDTPPFWRWFNNLILSRLKSLKNGEAVGEYLRAIFDGIAFPFIPKDLDSDHILLPLPNVMKLWTMLNLVLPKNGKSSDSAIRLYSAIQFVTFGVTDIKVLGNTHCEVMDHVVDFKNYLANIADREATTISNYSITDFNKSQVAGTLESFRLSELTAIKKEYFPEEEEDSGLDEDSHDPDDDTNLDPELNPDYSISKENADSDLDLDGDSDSTSDSDDQTTGEDSDDGDVTKDDTGDTATTDPSSIPGDPNTDPNQPEEVKEVSSKNAVSKKAYKGMWGDNPLELANDNDPEGYFYRNNVLTLNRQLQESPGDAIPRSTKNMLDQWCQFWINCADVRFTVMLVNKLGLSKFLKV